MMSKNKNRLTGSLIDNCAVVHAFPGTHFGGGGGGAEGNKKKLN